MSGETLTLLGTALIVAVPSGITAIMQRKTRIRVEATHEAVKVVNGVGPDGVEEEPLGDYVHRRFHSWDGRFDVMTAYLRRVDEKLGELVEQGKSDE